jgi:hypothetical protein
MKIYFYTSNNDDQSKDIIKYIKRIDFDLSTNITEGSTQDQSLDKIDALVVQGKKLDSKSGYLIALSLSQNKEVLVLLPKGSKADNTLHDLQQDKNFIKKLKVIFYTPESLAKDVIDWMQILDKDSVRDLVNIKYTLRVSSKISDYLNWKSKQLKMRKADWLRQQIKNMIEQDKKYQEFSEKKFSIDK